MQYCCHAISTNDGRLWSFEFNQQNSRLRQWNIQNKKIWRILWPRFPEIGEEMELKTKFWPSWSIDWDCKRACNSMELKSKSALSRLGVKLAFIGNLFHSIQAIHFETTPFEAVYKLLQKITCRSTCLHSKDQRQRSKLGFFLSKCVLSKIWPTFVQCISGILQFLSAV